MRSTLSEISAEAGVSEATVSRVINGRAGVSVATRHRVREVLERHGYGRHAASASSRLVGVVVPELVNPIFGTFADHMESQLSLHGFNAIIRCIRTTDDENEFADMLLKNGAAGMILISGTNSSANRDMKSFQALEERGLRFVLVNGPAPELKAPSLSTDFATGVNDSIAHLRSLGHGVIGLASGPETSHSSAQQIAAYRSMIDSIGINQHHVSSSYSVEGGDAATTSLLQQGVTAIIFGSDIMAMGGIRAAKRQGLSLPGDLSIVGMDNSTFMQFITPSLTTVRQPILEIAQEAVAFLLSPAEDDSSAKSDLLFRPELVVRASTAPARAEDDRSSAR